MLAKALVSILPVMSPQEILETTHIHSLHDKKYERIITARPFRSPHHSASDTSIIGGGQNPRPGEISLAHNGVLFFDELPEFRRPSIEALRQPLEDRVITIARAKDSLELPADFILVATANPCPCGYYGTSKECICPPQAIQTYRHKLSGPIIDRIDLYVDVDNIPHKRLLDKNSRAEPSRQIKKRVAKARSLQNQRLGGLKNNGQMTNSDLKRTAKLSPEARQLLDTGARKLGLSPRAYMRSLKVARTIADLQNCPSIEAAHIAEALQYRPKSPGRQT
jgi:magnesium chelatase family protein